LYYFFDYFKKSASSKFMNGPAWRLLKIELLLGRRPRLVCHEFAQISWPVSGAAICGGSVSQGAFFTKQSVTKTQAEYKFKV
jgi:hypothetical protein